MACQKMQMLLIAAFLPMLLSACGGQMLSEREIVRAICFEKKAGNYTACLLTADPNKEIAELKASCGNASTPAQALQRAADGLHGAAYYGLLETAILPSDAVWADVQEIGNLLYEKAQPTPEISVFLAQGSNIPPEQSYEQARNTEQRYALHCGLQQLFTQPAVCVVPCLAADGYSMALIAKETPKLILRGTACAQMAAILSRQTSELYGTFAEDSVLCQADARLIADGSTLTLQMCQSELQSMTDAGGNLAQVVEEELQQAFCVLCNVQQSMAADVFHFAFYNACTYGFQHRIEMPELKIVWK